MHESLTKQLSCGYKYSLSVRLNDLFTACGTEFLTLFRREGEELALLNLRLELFMIALLLGYIGIPSEKIGDVFKRHKFKYLRISSSGKQEASRRLITFRAFQASKNNGLEAIRTLDLRYVRMDDSALGRAFSCLSGLLSEVYLSTK